MLKPLDMLRWAIEGTMLTNVKRGRIRVPRRVAAGPLEHAQLLDSESVYTGELRSLARTTHCLELRK